MRIGTFVLLILAMDAKFNELVLVKSWVITDISHSVQTLKIVMQDDQNLCGGSYGYVSRYHKPPTLCRYPKNLHNEPRKCNFGFWIWVAK